MSIDLLDFLQQRPDVIGEVTEGGIRVSILGSRAQPHDRVELEQRLKRWCTGHPGVRAEVIG